MISTNHVQYNPTGHADFADYYIDYAYMIYGILFYILFLKYS